MTFQMELINIENKMGLCIFTNTLLTLKIQIIHLWSINKPILADNQNI